MKDRQVLSDDNNLSSPFGGNRSQPLMADGDIDPTFNASFTEANGDVRAIAVQPDGKIIAGGTFQRANGTRVSGIARFNADGSLDTSFNTGTGANNTIFSIVLQPDGKILVGGSFTAFNGQSVSKIVRLNPNGSIDSSFSTTVNFPNGRINDIKLQPDGKILVGGTFSLSSSRLARLNSDGTLDMVFTQSPMVYKIAYANGKILVGANSTGANAIRRFNLDGTPDSTFNVGTGPDGPVFNVVVQTDGKIILGGYFISYNGAATDSIVRINSDGSLDKVFEYADNNNSYIEIGALNIQPDGKILAHYFMQSASTMSRTLRFNTDATVDTTFASEGNSNGFLYYTLDIKFSNDGKIILGGLFTAYNNETHIRLVKVNLDGSVDSSFNASASDTGVVHAIKKQTDGKILVGGNFDLVNGVRKIGLARLNPDGSLDNSFNSAGTGFDGDIFALAIQPDGKIIVGGSFSSYNGVTAYHLVRLNSDGTLDPSLITQAASFSTWVVNAVALQPDGKILAAGIVNNNSTFDRAPVFRLNADGSVDSSFQILSSMGGTAHSIMVQPSGKIVIGGFFTTLNNLFRSGFARLNSNGSLDDFIFAGNSTVYSLVQQPDGSFYAGGNNLARYNADGTRDTSFDTGTGLNSSTRAIKVQPDGKVIAGGGFTTYNGTPVNKIIRVNPNGALDSSFSTTNGTPGSISALELQSDGKILAGGQFLDFNGTEKLSIVRLKNGGSRKGAFDFDGDGKTDISVFRPSLGEWWYSRSSDAQVPAVQFGSNTDKPVASDFTGDGKTDIAFWRPQTGEWFILRSEDGSFFSFPFGSAGDIPTPADFDGDGKADAAVFRPSSGTWFIQNSNGSGTSIVQFGSAEDKPVAADFDGDGKMDLAIFRPSDGSWWYVRSSDNQFRVFSFGLGTDKPVPGDYTGDGKADIAVYRPETGEWFFQRSEDNSYYSVPFGQAGDIPAPGDYDGDGKFDTAVFRPSQANWYVNRSTAGLLIQQFGASGDTPVPSIFVP